MKSNTRISSMSFASIYPHYIAKAEKKGHTQTEVDTIIMWLTRYTSDDLARILENGTNFEEFFGNAPEINPNASKITGTICGHRIENIEDPLMRNIRYLDKLIDELAHGRSMEKILRS